MPLEAMEEVGKAVEYRVLEKTASAFLQGEEVDAMVIILSGRYVLALSYRWQTGRLIVKSTSVNLSHVRVGSF